MTTTALTDQLARISTQWGNPSKLATGGVGLQATFKNVGNLDEAFKRIGATITVSVMAPAKVGGPLVVPLRSGSLTEEVGFFAKCLLEPSGDTYEMEMQLFAHQAADGVPAALVFQVIDNIIGQIAKDPVEGMVSYIAHRFAQPKLHAKTRRRMAGELAALVAEEILKDQPL